MSGKIGIVTVLYKSESVLHEFFESLEAQTYKNFILYIVDNKSPDNSLAISEAFKIKSTFETVVIANDDNYGVAKGNNIGIKQALADNCDYVLISNNDVVFDRNTIDYLLQGLVTENIDLIAPKIYFYKTNLLWYAGGGYTKHNGWCTHRGYQQEDIGQFDSKEIVDYAPTCFLLMRKELFTLVGLMDEIYFVYWDDTDFIYRATKQGNTLMYFPQAMVYHNESTSTGFMSDFSIYYKYRNFVYFTFKNRQYLHALYLLIFNIGVHLIKHLFSWNYKQWKKGCNAYFEGVKLSKENGYL